MASLTIVVDGAEQRHPLEAAAVTLGRGLESDIRLKDIKASRRHCQIVKTAKGYQCNDLSSGNGTYVNGVQIKSQLLVTGDKITIGSTTIAFEEAAPATRSAAPKPSPAKAATAKIPVAAAAASSSKVATAKVQVAPTRKVTSRVEASSSAKATEDRVKSASQGALKPATQPLAKSASRVGKPAGRVPGTRPRPAPETPKKKSPTLLVAAVVGVLALAGGGWFLFASRDNTDHVGAQIKQLMKKAEEAEKAEKFDAAVQDYRKALDLCQGERYKLLASEITKVLARLDTRRNPAKPDPAPRDPAGKTPDFEAKRTEIADRFKLAGDAADWGGALKEWSEFSRLKAAAELKPKTEAEIRTILGKAKQDLDRLRKKAEALAGENKMAEALDLLKQQKPRFENTELQADLDAAIRQYDK